MASSALLPTTSDRPTRLGGPTLLAVAMVAFVALLRLPALGDPIVGVDEQFYLLVGDRLWDGALPYLDIWDRKPAGLFLLYAMFRMFPGDGVLAYQIAGTISLAATGFITAHITQRVLPWQCGVIAGFAVIFYGALLGSGFGEAPIFYDLLTALAGALTLRVREHPAATGNRARALGAMTLCGVALTLKTSAVFESCCFGLLLMMHDWRATRTLRPVLLRMAGYIAVGLGPMALIAAFYWVIGGFDAFWFANFQSVFLRTDGATAESMARCLGFLLLLSPLTIPALAEWRSVQGERRIVLAAWALAGVLSFVAIGRCFDHYVLPLVTPLALLAAYGLRRRLVALGAGAVLIALALRFATTVAAPARRDEADFASLAAHIPETVKTGCLFVYEGPTILYQRTRACLAGRYVFPGHFTDEVESSALEQPSATILQAVLARRPAVIVASPDSRAGNPPTRNDQILAASLRASYRPIARQSIRLTAGQRIGVIVWQRRV